MVKRHKISSKVVDEGYVSKHKGKPSGYSFHDLVKRPVYITCIYCPEDMW